MNYLLLFQVLLGLTIVVGFFCRYRAVLKHGGSTRSGRFQLFIISSAVLYTGVIFASIDKVPYSSLCLSALVFALVCLALETTLHKLAKYV